MDSNNIMNTQFCIENRECCMKLDLKEICKSEEQMKLLLTTKDPIYISSICLFVFSLLLFILASVLYFKSRALNQTKLSKVISKDKLSKTSTSSINKIEKTIHSIPEEENNHTTSLNASQLPLVTINEPTNDTYVVSTDYQPILADEILLEKGDMVQIQIKFEDGWALGRNLSNDKTGAFPLACLYQENIKNGFTWLTTKTNAIARRTSSQRTSRYLN